MNYWRNARPSGDIIEMQNGVEDAMCSIYSITGILPSFNAGTSGTEAGVFEVQNSAEEVKDGQIRNVDNPH
jgi:hypothetical protein